MADKKIKIGRYRNIPFIVNYNNGVKKSYTWAGSKGKMIDSKELEEEIVNWLIMETTAISSGELVIMGEDEVSEEIKSNIADKEIYEENIHTRQEIEAILTGNTNVMKAELKKITIKEEKNFICNIAKEMKLDSSAKRKFLAEWVGVEEAMLFGEL